ncbi:hypothetical protein V6N12_063543 [Hibiscus sabdariffa]|uniref:Uncharacterized protein n=1 Tax=Hibiscus sabdariffa TaxID=183260 RepID=A0ABR2FCG1_9ROSI
MSDRLSFIHHHTTTIRRSGTMSALCAALLDAPLHPLRRYIATGQAAIEALLVQLRSCRPCRKQKHQQQPRYRDRQLATPAFASAQLHALFDAALHPLRWYIATGQAAIEALLVQLRSCRPCRKQKHQQQPRYRDRRLTTLAFASAHVHALSFERKPVI